MIAHDIGEALELFKDHCERRGFSDVMVWNMSHKGGNGPRHPNYMLCDERIINIHGAIDND